MRYRGVDYSLILAMAPDRWRWHFEIGEKSRTGHTVAKLHLLAERRVQMIIDRELRSIELGARPGQDVVPALALTPDARPSQ